MKTQKCSSWLPSTVVVLLGAGSCGGSGEVAVVVAQ